MNRLNQLQFLDESKAGFILVWCLLVTSTLLEPFYGGYFGLTSLGLPRTPSLIGALQVSLLFAVAASVFFFGAYRSKRQLCLRPVEEVDPLLASEAKRIAAQITNQSIEFFVTSNIFDINAFCTTSLRKKKIVLGGGLRLLFLKKPEAARAIIAHECAHIRQGDTVFLLVTWYFFLAFIVLVLINLLQAQLHIWFDILEKRPYYQSAGWDLFDVIYANARPIFISGVAGVVSIASISIALIHFIKTREYRADEKASQAGYREALKASLLPLSIRPNRKSIRLLSAFHPSARSRLRHISTEVAWAKLDWLFCGAMAVVISRISVLLVELLKPSEVSVDLAISDNIGDFVDAIFLLGPKLFLYLGLLGTLTSFIASHFYRVAATQYNLGRSFSERILVVIPGIIAAFVGALFGTMTSLGELMYIDKTSTVAGAIDSAIVHSSGIAYFTVWVGVSLAILVRPVLKRFQNSTFLRRFWLIIATLITMYLTQVIASIVLIVLSYSFGVSYPNFQISWLPGSTWQPYPGSPNAIQQILTFLVLSGAMAFFVRIRKHSRTPKEHLDSDVHPSRLLGRVEIPPVATTSLSTEI